MEQLTGYISVFLCVVAIGIPIYFIIKFMNSGRQNEKISFDAKYITKKYTGDESTSLNKFNKDSIQMANKGYYPKSQNYIPGQYGCISFLSALLLCIILIGFIVFIYMLIVKPEGSLVVLYELKENEAELINDKTCPMCAETVKFEAKICRFCNYIFIKT